MKDDESCLNNAAKRITVICLCLSPILTGAACQRQPAVAVIGIPQLNQEHLLVANDEIGSWKASSDVQIRLVGGPDIPKETDHGSAEVMSATQLVKAPGIVGVVGHQDSRFSLTTAPIYNEAHIPQIVPTGTSSLLKTAGPWTFMLAPDDQLEGAFIGDFVVGHLQARSATVFYQLDEYGRGLRDGVVAALNRQGVKVIDQIPFDQLHNPSSPTPDFDFPSIVAASLLRGVPDVVIIAGRSREAAEAARLFHERAPEIQFVGGDGVEMKDIFLDKVGRAVDSFFIVAFWHAASGDEISRAYVDRFRRINGRDPLPGDAMIHDGIMLLAHAARAVGANPAAIRQYLDELGHGRPPYHGATGLISFAKDRRARLIMTRVHHGVAIPVTTN